jgi:hypothetical protein
VPIYLDVGVPGGVHHAVLVQVGKWWGNPGQTIAGGRPYIRFYEFAVLGGKDSMQQLERAAFSVTIRPFDSALVFDAPGAGMKPTAASLYVCPSDLEAPKQADCMFADQLTFKFQSADGSNKVVANPPQAYEFRTLADALVSRGQAISIRAPSQGQAHEQWQIIQAAAAKRQSDEREQQASIRRREAELAAAERARGDAATKEFFRIAGKGATLFCDSERALLAGGTLDKLPFACNFPKIGRRSIQLPEVLNAGWVIESQNRAEADMWFGRGQTVSVILRKSM